MVATTALAAEVTNVVRDLGTGVQTRVLNWIVLALDASASLIGPTDDAAALDEVPDPSPLRIVDPWVTRC